MNKLKLWDQHSSFEAAESCWEQRKQEAEKKRPIKKLQVLPAMVGITPETAKGLKWKAFKWMLTKDHGGKVFKGFIRHPLKYGLRYLTSLFQAKSYRRSGDFFFYNIASLDQLVKLVKDEDTLFVMGFSYCHKPFECPSGRFTAKCQNDLENPVCQQCFIGKAVHALPDRVKVLYIPTVHYIGEQIFALAHANPRKQIAFMITACEMTLEMFGDWGNMVGIKGVGVRLGGRICNTMKAFELSENGIKPGLTVVLEETQQQILQFIKQLR